MPYPFPAYDFSQILLWKDPEPRGAGERFPADPELLQLGLFSVIDLAPTSRTRGKWALNFVRPLSSTQLDEAILRVRRLTEQTIREIGPTPRRYFQAESVAETLIQREEWAADRARACRSKVAAAPPPCGAELLRKRAWAAYYPGWQLEAAGTSLALGSKQKIEIVVLDSGADVAHPALLNLISAFSPVSLEDLAGHGSHVVSTICGNAWGTQSAVSIQLGDDYNVDFLPAGVLPNKPIRLGNVAKANPVVGCDGPSAFEVDWILYMQALNALDNTPTAYDARLLNLSLGGPVPSLLEQHVLAQIALEKTLVVAAAGNHTLGDSFTQVLYPAGYPECVSVGASSRNLSSNGFPYEPWNRSNNGKTAARSSVGRAPVDVYAPGRNIVGALPVSLLNKTRPCGYKSGTSMATAFATGIFAVRLSRLSNLPSILYKDAVDACDTKLPYLANGGGHMVDLVNFVG